MVGGLAPPARLGRPDFPTWAQHPQRIPHSGFWSLPPGILMAPTHRRVHHSCVGRCSCDRCWSLLKTLKRCLGHWGNFANVGSSWGCSSCALQQFKSLLRCIGGIVTGRVNSSMAGFSRRGQAIRWHLYTKIAYSRQSSGIHISLGS